VPIIVLASTGGPEPTGSGKIVTRRNGMFRTRRALKLIGSGLLLTSPCVAHHSTDANFDRTSTISVKGVVTAWKLQNPHAFFTVDVTDEGGEIQNWLIVLSAKNQLIRTGRWDEDTFQPGQLVTAFGWEGYREGQMFLTKVVLSDGTVLEPGPILTDRPARN
jgi:hypothetical protein